MDKEREAVLMFNHIGRKIKTWAKIQCWIGIILCVIAGVSFITAGEVPIQQTVGSTIITTTVQGPLIGALIIVLGSLLSWIGSWITYGFGSVVENTEQLWSQMEQVNTKLNELSRRE